MGGTLWAQAYYGGPFMGPGLLWGDPLCAWALYGIFVSLYGPLGPCGPQVVDAVACLHGHHTDLHGPNPIHSSAQLGVLLGHAAVVAARNFAGVLCLALVHLRAC